MEKAFSSEANSLLHSADILYITWFIISFRRAWHGLCQIYSTFYNIKFISTFYNYI